MKQRYLEVTFLRGKPVAAYLYLPRDTNDHSARTEKREKGLLVDYAADGRAIGIEITAPNQVTLEAINHTLAALAEEPATSEEFAPVAGG